jgi:hypothetical protein
MLAGDFGRFCHKEAHGADDRILGRGPNRRQQAGSLVLHAEMEYPGTGWPPARGGAALRSLMRRQNGDNTTLY